jgi:two-component system response regulator PilR (NtrC family)
MQKSRILIVDDEADIRELLSLTLQRMGLDTDCAGNEFEATQFMQKHSYDLCLTDMRLPDGDGLQLLEHVSKHYATTPVAVITAHGSGKTVAALKAGAFDYLAKPVSLNQLRWCVGIKLPRPNQQKKGGDKEADAGGRVLLGDSALMQQTRQMID